MTAVVISVRGGGQIYGKMSGGSFVARRKADGIRHSYITGRIGSVLSSSEAPLLNGEVVKNDKDKEVLRYYFFYRQTIAGMFARLFGEHSVVSDIPADVMEYYSSLFDRATVEVVRAPFQHILTIEYPYAARPRSPAGSDVKKENRHFYGSISGNNSRAGSKSSIVNKMCVDFNLVISNLSEEEVARFKELQRSKAHAYWKEGGLVTIDKICEEADIKLIETQKQDVYFDLGISQGDKNEIQD